jgi:[ribosomal protein S18]-alanine N-acetyltransferase
MIKDDIPQVTAVDREAFPTMWPPVNFSGEMRNRLAHYLVACDCSKTADPVVEKPLIQLVPVRSFLGIKWPFASKPAPASPPDPQVLDFITGFVGLWLMVDEAHIINIAVKETYRGKGIGELLLIASIELSLRIKATVVTLEVRASNTIAQNLYTKYGFSQMGVRKGYYTDNKEDAFIMTTDLIKSESFQKRFGELKEAHLHKLGKIDYRLV